MQEAPALISLGTITKPQGLKGAFRVYPHGGKSESLDALERVTLAPRNGAPFETTVRHIRRKGNVFIFEVEGVDSIEAVEPYVNGGLLAPEADLQPLQDDEFYWYQIAGMEVVTEQGRNLGTVRALLATGANDVIEVHDGHRELLLPNIPDVVLTIDHEARRITVRLLPGLE